MPVTKATKKAQKAAIVEGLAENSSITDACKKAGVDRKSYYRWIEDDPEFAESVTAALRNRITIAKDVAFGNALRSSKDPRYQTSLIAWLNNEGGWNNPHRHEVTGPEGAPLAVQIYIPSNGRDPQK